MITALSYAVNWILYIHMAHFSFAYVKSEAKMDLRSHYRYKYRIDASERMNIHLAFPHSS